MSYPDAAWERSIHLSTTTSRVGPPADDWRLTASNDSDLLGARPAECSSLSS
jgi:hypothetical protein